MMRVDDESRDPTLHQMIERERDERLLADRDQRLRSLSGETAQPCAKARPEDERTADRRAQSVLLHQFDIVHVERAFAGSE